MSNKRPAAFWIRNAVICLLSAVPMFVLDFSPWIIAPVCFVMLFLYWSIIPYFGIWIWAAVVIIQRPFTWFTVVYFVLMVIELVGVIGTVILVVEDIRFRRTFRKHT